MGCGKQRESTAPIKSLVKLQPRFLSLRWKTCLRQNCSLGSSGCSEGPAFGQNTDDDDDDDYIITGRLRGASGCHPPPTSGVPSSHLDLSKRVSWWTKSVFSVFLPFSLSINFIPPLIHSHFIYFISSHSFHSFDFVHFISLI